MIDVLAPLRVKLATGGIVLLETYRGLALRVIEILYGEDYVELLALNPSHVAPGPTFSHLLSGALPDSLTQGPEPLLREYAQAVADRWWYREGVDVARHFVSVDGVPWEIHAVHGVEARIEAAAAYLEELRRCQ